MLKQILIAAPLVLVASAGGAYWYANAEARSIVDQRLDELVVSGGYDKATYDAMSVGWNGAITMKNLNIVNGPLDYTLHDITITNFDYTNAFPRHMDLSLKGLRLAPIDAGVDPQLAAFSALMQLDGDTVPLELTYSHNYEPDNAHQMDSTMRIIVPESFTLEYSGVTRNLEMGGVAAMDAADPLLAQQQMTALLAAAEFPSTQMRLQDQGFPNGVLAASAQQNGVATEEFRRLLVSQVQNFYLFLPPTAQDFATAAGAEMAEFLEGGKTISVSVTPEYGGKVQQLQAEIMGAVFTGDYGKVSELLHLEIVTEP